MEIFTYDILFRLIHKYTRVHFVGDNNVTPTYSIHPDDFDSSIACFSCFINGTSIFYNIVDDNRLLSKHNIRFIYLDEGIQLWMFEDKELIWK